MSKPNRRRVVAPAPASNVAPAPAPAPAPVVEQQVAPAPVVELTDDPSLSAELKALIANATTKHDAIQTAIAAVEQGKVRGYEDSLTGSQLFANSWVVLSQTQPTPVNQAPHASEFAFRSALDRADAATSPLVIEEISTLAKLAVYASTVYNVDAARLVPKVGKYVASRRPVKSAQDSIDARNKLDGLLKLYSSTNQGALLAHLTQEAIDSIDKPADLVRFAVKLQNGRSNSTKRRVVLSYLSLIKDTFEGLTNAEERGAEYLNACRQAHDAWKEYMFGAIKDKVAPDAAKLELAVNGKVASYLKTLKGDEQAAPVIVSPEELLKRLYAMLDKCAKRGAISDAAKESAKSALGNAGYKNPDDKSGAPATINGGGSVTGKAREKAPVAATVSEPQPVTQPTQAEVKPVAVLIPAAQVKARGRARTPAPTTVPNGPDAAAAAKALSA